MPKKAAKPRKPRTAARPPRKDRFNTQFPSLKGLTFVDDQQIGAVHAALTDLLHEIRLFEARLQPVLDRADQARQAALIEW